MTFLQMTEAVEAFTGKNVFPRTLVKIMLNNAYKQFLRQTGCFQKRVNLWAAGTYPATTTWNPTSTSNLLVFEADYLVTSACPWSTDTIMVVKDIIGYDADNVMIAPELMFNWYFQKDYGSIFITDLLEDFQDDVARATLHYIATPADLSTDASTPVFPSDFHMALVHQVAGELVGPQGNLPMAQWHQSRYERFRKQAIGIAATDGDEHNG